MSTIKIKTLTAVHIGSGETLHYGTDFLRGEHKGRSILSIVDLKKVMELIKPEHVQDWVTCIEDGESTDVVVQRYKPDATMADYSKRMISDCANDKESDSLKTQIHDGFGRPYIPGSSIKGAIRTAILSFLVDELKEKKDIENIIDKTYKDKKGKMHYKADAKQIESELFGDNPKQDLFRFFRVGDAIFGENDGVALNMVNINERKGGNYWDTEKSQLIEAIAPIKHTEFELKMGFHDLTELLKKLGQKGYKYPEYKAQRWPQCMGSIADLFDTINNHTQQLLKAELEYWGEREHKDSKRKVTEYLNKIDEMLSETQQCKPGQECVLRIGQGSGWRFITGAWTEDLENFDDLVVPISRHDSYKYIGYNFPKTRRVDDQCELLGFVKLSIKEETA